MIGMFFLVMLGSGFYEIFLLVYEGGLLGRFVGLMGRGAIGVGMMMILGIGVMVDWLVVIGVEVSVEFGVVVWVVVDIFEVSFIWLLCRLLSIVSLILSGLRKL